MSSWKARIGVYDCSFAPLANVAFAITPRPLPGTCSYLYFFAPTSWFSGSAVNGSFNIEVETMFMISFGVATIEIPRPFAKRSFV